MSDGETKDTFPHRHVLMTGLLLLPVIFLLAEAGFDLIRYGHHREITCWVLPNSRVLQTPATPNCPLESGDVVRRVEVPDATLEVHDQPSLSAAIDDSIGPLVRVQVERDGDPLWMDISVKASSQATRAVRIAMAVVMSGFLLGIPLYLLWHAVPSVAVPLAIFYSAVSTVVVTFLVGQRSEIATRLAMASLSFVPAALTHLAFTFPHERPVSRNVPRLKYTPYAVSALLLLVGAFALERDFLLWQPFGYLLASLTAAAWLVLMIACGHSLRESRSSIERARARLVFFGSMLLPLGPTLMSAPTTRTTIDLVFVYLWTVPIAMTLPVALAISRYNLFDLGWDIRYWVGRLLFLGLSALIMALVLDGALTMAQTPVGLRELEPLFLVSLACVALVEALRGRLAGLVENTAIPRLQQLRVAREAFEREISTLRDEDTVTHRLADALADSIGPHSGSLFIESPTCCRLARVFGSAPPTSPDLVAAAHQALGTRLLIHVAATEASTPALNAMRDEGIELAAAIESGGERFGVLLLGSSTGRWPYTGIELDFISALAGQAGIALRNCQITGELLAQEHHATAGRVALGVAHEVGKELAWIRRLARKLAEPKGDSDRQARDASMLVEMTEGASAALKRFVDYATRDSPDPSASLPLDRLVERAARQVCREHGSERVSQVIAPSARQISCNDNLGRALFNLLDNAVHASPESETVRLFATCDESWLRVEIEDHGCGIADAAKSQVFDPGYSTRREAGGSGVGLTVAKEIIETLGGHLELCPALPRGTRACFRVPTTR